MGMEHWNDTDRGKLKYGERNIIQRGWELNEWVWSIVGMILTGEDRRTGRKTCYSDTFSTRNVDVGLHLGIRGERPVVQTL